MSMPIYLHSGQTNSPTLTPTNGSLLNVLEKCLVTGFNEITISSIANISSNVLNLPLPSGHGFQLKDTVRISGSSSGVGNGDYRVIASSSNQISVAINASDQNLSGTITVKFAPLGWSKPFTFSNNKGVFRQGGLQTHKRYYYFDNSQLINARAYVKIYNTMTNVTTGTNVVPSTSISTTGYDILIHSFWDTLSQGPWAIIGTNRTFYLLISHQQDYTVNRNFRNDDVGYYCFGDLGKIQTPTDISNQVIPKSHNWPTSGSALMGSANNNLNGSYNIQNYAFGGNNTFCLGLLSPDPISGNNIISGKIFIHDSDSNSTRGILKGLYCSINAQVFYGGLMPGEVLQNFDGINSRLLCMYNSFSPIYSESFLSLDLDWD